MRVTCQCGGTLRRPIPPTCPHCGALLVGARRRTLQLAISWGIAVSLAAGLMVVLLLFVKFVASRAPAPKPPQDRPFERSLQ